MPTSSRRRLLALLGGVAVPARSWADSATPAPAESVPVAPATPSSPTVPSVVIPPAAPPAATAHPANTVINGIDKSKIYYLFFEQSIDVASIKALRKQLVALTEAGVADITIVISSPGGAVVAALNTFGFINALPARINTHAQGWVASAAMVLMLAGQRRTADRGAQFLFHPTQTAMLGNLNEQQMQDQLTMLADVDAALATIYRERTRLTDADIQRFQHETVIFNAEQALTNQIVDGVADLRIPGDQKAKVLFVE